MVVATNAMQFIATAGISNFVCGVQTGMIAADRARDGFKAIGTAIDGYVEVQPRMASLIDVRESIGGLPDRISQGEVIRMIEDHSSEVDRAVRFAVKASEVGAARAAGLEVPFDVGAEWRWIPAGEFRMGSAKDDPLRYDDEKVLETVMTGGFFMLDHPVTNAEFRTFLDAVGRKDLRDLERRFAGDLQPAVRVMHEEAAAYSKWLGEKLAESMDIPIIGRLPTEEEWEKAAKGPGGDEFASPATSEQAHFDASATRVVDNPDVYANGYGLKDMIGNVWEWTSSPWEEGSSRFVLRGASWHSDVPGRLRAAGRGYGRPDGRGVNIGFRAVLVPQDSKK